jgi:hypothetical protein
MNSGTVRCGAGKIREKQGRSGLELLGVQASHWSLGPRLLGDGVIL